MKVQNWLWITLAAGPRLTWWMVLLYYGAVPLLILAMVVALIPLVPHNVVGRALEFVEFLAEL